MKQTFCKGGFCEGMHEHERYDSFFSWGYNSCIDQCVLAIKNIEMWEETEDTDCEWKIKDKIIKKLKSMQDSDYHETKTK